MPQHSDPRIPTLTQRVEPTVGPAQSDVTGMEQTKHDDLPVLTDRAQSAPAFQPQPAPPPPWDEDELPVLTDIAKAPGAPETPGTQNAHPDAAPTPETAPDAAGGVGSPQAAFSTATPSGSANLAVLRAALQAEFEQTLQQALDQATTTLQARLEAELPAMIERALNKVRPG